MFGWLFDFLFLFFPTSVPFLASITCVPYLQTLILITANTHKARQPSLIYTSNVTISTPLDDCWIFWFPLPLYLPSIYYMCAISTNIKINHCKHPQGHTTIPDIHKQCHNFYAFGWPFDVLLFPTSVPFLASITCVPYLQTWRLITANTHKARQPSQIYTSNVTISMLLDDCFPKFIHADWWRQSWS